MTEYQHYVAGFLFDDYNVALVKKSRPEWQSGYWNGIGGKIESLETAENAMTREFNEETGLYVSQEAWDYYACVQGSWGIVHFYRAFVDTKTLFSVKTMEDEEIKVWGVNLLPDNLMSNLKWLIPLALHPQRYEPIHARDAMEYE